jgi:hypothetical protein
VPLNRHAVVDIDDAPSPWCLLAAAPSADG